MFWVILGFIIDLIVLIVNICNGNFIYNGFYIVLPNNEFRSFLWTIWLWVNYVVIFIVIFYIIVYTIQNIRDKKK